MKYFRRPKSILFKDPNSLLSLPGRNRKEFLRVFKDNNTKITTFFLKDKLTALLANKTFNRFHKDLEF